MAGILTPVSIWNDFKTVGEKNYTVLNETVKDGVVFTRFTIDGKPSDGAATVIYLVSARSERLSLSPCVFVLPDFEKDIDEDYLFDLAKRGYTAVSADFSGKKQGKEFYTVYPSGASYADYESVKSDVYQIPTDVKHSCWYEWGAVAKYSLSYLFNNSLITGVGAIGVGLGASVLWQVAASEFNLSCAAFIFDAGWNAYFKKGNRKIDGVAPDFDDNDLKVLAGVDAQAYASFIKVPSLVVSATNSYTFDFDRSADTVIRMTNAPYAAIDYSVNRVDVIDKSCYDDVNYFFDKILLKGATADVLPPLPEAECCLDDGEIEIQADAAADCLKKVIFYAAEGDLKQQFRSWKVAGEIEADEYCDGQFVFRYLPYSDSGVCFFFVRAVYQGGFTVASPVISKKFTSNEIKNPFKSKILYSGREKFSASAFSHCGGNSFADLTTLAEEKGSLDIKGLKIDGGVMTFKINAEKDKPNDDSIFILDVCAERGAKITFSLLTGDDFRGKSYSVSFNLPAVRGWRNLTLALNKFKSEEGMGLKDYSSVRAIKITCTEPVLLNNFLWV